MESHKPTLRVLQILKLVDDHTKNGIALSEISEQLNIPKGTISPILRTLLDEGYISLDGQNKHYTIGHNSFELGLSYGSENDLISMIQGKMRQIVGNVDEICQFGVLSDLNVLYLLKESPNNVISIISNVGDKIPAHVSGLGKALLSGKSDEQLKEYYLNYKFERFTKNSITSTEDLLAQINAVRETGLSYDIEESKEDVCCVAVPLVINDHIRAALSVTTPKFRYTDDAKSEIIAQLQEKKKIIEDICRVQNYKLGY